MLPPQLSPARLRLATMTPRERGFVAAGLIAILAFVLYLLVRGDVEPEALPPPTPLLTPAPAPIVAPPPVIAVMPPPPALPPLVLHGVFAGGPGGGAAVIASGGGGQRVVRIGRPVAAGVVLTSVGRDHVLLDVGGAPMRLAFGRAAEPAAAPAVPAQAAVPAGSSTTDYRLGLRPAAPDGGGYVVKPDARLPLLAAAGLQPGDVIVSVNGSAFDEERLLDLSWQAANSDRVTFEYLRNGRKMSGTIERP